MPYTPDSYPRQIPQFKVHGRGEVTVSAKGIITGDSNIPNNGADFGPDTMLGATAPGQYGPSYTQTMGWQEATRYAESIAVSTPQGVRIPTILGMTGQYSFTASVQFGLTSSSKYTFMTTGRNNALITSPDSTPISFFTMSGNAISDFEFNGISFDAAPDGSTLSFFAYDATQTSNANNGRFIRTHFSGTTQNGYVDITNQMSHVMFFDCFPNGLGETALNMTAVNKVSIFGGNWFGDILLDNVIDFAMFGSKLHYDFSIKTTNFARQIRLYGCEDTGNPSNPIVAIGSGSTVDTLILDVAIPDASAAYAPVTNAGTLFYFKWLGGYSSQPLTMPVLATPFLSANPPASGTVYQNTNPYDIEIDLPVYATTAGTAGYVTVAKGATSTPTAIGNQYVNGATSSTSVDIIKLRVPVGWYYEFTSSGVTFGTASVFAD